MAAEIERVDAPITKIADQQVTAEPAERGGGQCETPGRVERAVRREAVDEVPIGVELIDEPIACA
jgi:hypothetical protein